MNKYTEFDAVAKSTGNKIHCNIISRRLSQMLIRAQQDRWKKPVCLILPPARLFNYHVKLFQPTEGTFLLTKIEGGLK